MTYLLLTRSVWNPKRISFMKDIGSIAVIAAAAASTCVSMGDVALAQSRSNPVDQVSNPTALDFTNVEVGHREFREPFIRDGALTESQRLPAITREMSQSEVRSSLGEPLQTRDPQGPEWNYNFKFKLPLSNNYIVCQYKVLFDAQGKVTNAVWRRRQCKQLATPPK